MATISTSTSTDIYQLQKWLGLNESPDGDTGLDLGEAAEMRNFRITRENHLQIRPGYNSVCTVTEGKPIRGMWCGYVDGKQHVLVSCNGRLWDVDIKTGEAEDVGDLDDEETFFFGFDKKVYILTGVDYYCWDGLSPVYEVDGYIPIVSTAVPPTGGGTILERANLLTGKRRAQFSPDGQATVFTLPETGVDEILYVEGTDITWTADMEAGTITFASAPEKGVNTIEITWRKGLGNRYKVISMKYAETYNGSTDARVFLYGDGTNETVYSDLDEDGKPNAEYFPDLNTMAVDSANTPVTALIRHYDRLLAFKSDGAYSVSFGNVTTGTGDVTAGFYVTPINKVIGCEAVGQARLIQNDPRVLFGRSVYSWSTSSTRDERNAKRISDRVEATLNEFDLSRCKVFDDEQRQEYYIFCDGKAVIHNYGNDTWYVYTNMPVNCMEQVNGELYFGTEDGRIMWFSREFRNDDLKPIDAYWESGALDFEKDWRRKYSATLWVSIKPEGQGRVYVTAQSNRKSGYAEKIVNASLATFDNADFGNWSFLTNRKPQVQRVKLKVKKFTFYKLIFSSCSASSTATVLAADIQVRYTGNVK